MICSRSISRLCGRLNSSEQRCHGRSRHERRKTPNRMSDDMRSNVRNSRQKCRRDVTRIAQRVCAIAATLQRRRMARRSMDTSPRNCACDAKRSLGIVLRHSNSEAIATGAGSTSTRTMSRPIRCSAASAGTAGRARRTRGPCSLKTRQMRRCFRVLSRRNFQSSNATDSKRSDCAMKCPSQRLSGKPLTTTWNAPSR